MLGEIADVVDEGCLGGSSSTCGVEGTILIIVSAASFAFRFITLLVTGIEVLANISGAKAVVQF